MLALEAVLLQDGSIWKATSAYIEDIYVNKDVAFAATMKKNVW